MYFSGSKGSDAMWQFLLSVLMVLWLNCSVSADDFNKGMIAAQNGDYETAMRLWTPLAERGDVAAQNNIGLMYENGEGVPQDHYTAVKWYTLAAEQGFVTSQFKLASKYILGQGVQQSDTTAFKWCKLAAEQGLAIAQYNLGAMYGNGRGTQKNQKMKIIWYTRAAEQGYLDAQFDLGVIYSEGIDVPQDFEVALRWYKLAAEQNYLFAQYNLGLLYATGKGVEQNYGTALEWYARSAELGHDRSQFNLGLMYANGEGVSQNYTEAIKWYGLAADQGLPDAQHNLGLLYFEGKGVSKNIDTARKWMTLSANQGFVESSSILERMNPVDTRLMVQNLLVATFSFIMFGLPLGGIIPAILGVIFGQNETVNSSKIAIKFDKFTYFSKITKVYAVILISALLGRYLPMAGIQLGGDSKILLQTLGVTVPVICMGWVSNYAAKRLADMGFKKALALGCIVPILGHAFVFYLALTVRQNENR